MEETIRQKKYARLLQKEMSDLFQREGKEYTSNSLMTITLVRTSPDLALAKIYVSFLPEQDAQQKVERLEAEKYQIRYMLGKRIGKEVRIIPELAFFLDDTLEEANRINSLIDRLEIPPLPEEEED